MRKLRGDLHVHSTMSDGKTSPKEIVLKVLELGFDIVAVTDHDTFEGSLQAARYVKSTGYELIPLIAAEIRTEAGDVLVYCPEKPLSRIPRRLEDLVDHAHEEGCIVVAAHPFDARRYGVGERIYDVDFDAIEVFNANADPLSNRRALEAAKSLGKPGLANSDAHVLDFVGSSFNIIEADDDPGSVIKAIRDGRVTPVPGRPGPMAYIKAVAWSVERRLRRGKRDEPSRLDYLEDFQDYAPV
ncbi:PHP domain protein [Pyrolobus fumarii 1A]|uniref:PHP domain protein n=1 Tax=Pyrolobus fumarii (strain DSM 11204 / 1A) TaxID=694429 RepID=G0ED66_PYRF1|nr:PHP domain-containing protein [Pyrolobus fumarii]AEM39744.1 PHP domain protein [Pyrolobus fumarii 1A]